MAEIEFVDLTINYRKCTVIEGLSCVAPAGEITALVGPSGSGKSTLLGAINRMTDMIPSCHVRGDVRVDGESVFDTRIDPIQLRRQVGMVFQQPSPFPVSIAKNMTLPLRELGLPSNEVEERAVTALKSAALWDEVCDRLTTPAMELSGGQQQRLCIARALALRPKVLLLDEPCSALDHTATELIEQTLLALVGRVTIVIATHNLDQARRISSQVLQLEKCC